MKVKPDIKAEVTFLCPEEGGRKGPVRAKEYRCIHLIKEGYLTDAEHEYIDDRPYVPLGETVVAYIKFIDPPSYPQSLWIGRVLTVQEGTKIVGHAKVVEIYNPLLDRDADWEQCQ